MALTLIVGSPLSASAESHHEGEMKDMTPKQVAEQMITSYDAQKYKRLLKTDDDRFMNEMVANQERMQTELEKKLKPLRKS